MSALKLVFTFMKKKYKFKSTLDKNQFTSHKFSATTKINKLFEIKKGRPKTNPSSIL